MTGLEPATLAWIGLALSGVEAVGAIVQGNAQARASERNAANNDMMARQSILTAQENERRQREENARRMGTAAANRGASGVALEGSPLEVFEDEAAAAELAALDIRYGGLNTARYYQQAASNDRAEASRLRSGSLWSAAGTLIGGGLTAGHSLISGGGATLGNSGYRYAQAAQTTAASTRGRTPF